MPQISIIVPVYKVPEAYFRQCIESLTNQTLQDIEIILIDDGSPDDCGKICDEYASKDKRLIVIHQSNLGVSVARNSGLKRATADWIAFVDADDWIEYITFEYILKIAGDTKADLVMWNTFLNYKSQETPILYKGEDSVVFSDVDRSKLELQMFYHNDPHQIYTVRSPGCKLYKKSILVNHNITFHERLYFMEDFVFNFDVIENCTRIVYKNHPLYHYRMYSSSSMLRFDENYVHRIVEPLKVINSLIIKYCKQEILQEAFNSLCVGSLSMLLRGYYFNKDNPRKLIDNINDFHGILRHEPYLSTLKKVKYKLLTKKQKINLLLIKMRMTFLIYYLNLIMQLLYKKYE